MSWLIEPVVLPAFSITFHPFSLPHFFQFSGSYVLNHSRCMTTAEATVTSAMSLFRSTLHNSCHTKSSELWNQIIDVFFKSIVLTLQHWPMPYYFPPKADVFYTENKKAITKSNTCMVYLAFIPFNVVLNLWRTVLMLQWLTTYLWGKCITWLVAPFWANLRFGTCGKV